MERFNLKRFGALLLLAVFLGSCANLQQMADNADLVNYDVNPSPMEMHAGKVNVKVQGRFPAEYFNKNAVIEATPVLKYEGKSKELSKIYLQGEGVTESNYPVISWDNGGTFSWEETFDYEDDMKVSSLVLDVTASAGGESVDVSDAKKLADGIIVTPLLVQKGLAIDNGAGYESGEEFASFETAKVKLQETATETYKSDIHFALQSSDLKYSERRAEDISEMLDRIEAAIEKELDFQKVNVSSYASPDGPLEKINEPLSSARGDKTKDWLKRSLRGTGLEGYDQDGSYQVEATPEDWDGFRELLQNSNLQDKDAILRVLNMYNDVERREQEIKNMAEAYESLKTDILPALRRSKIDVDFQISRRTDAELRDLVKNNPEKLDNNEMLYAAKLMENLDDRIDVYDATIELFPEDWRAYNNKGVTLAHQNKMSQAKEQFETAKDKNSGAFQVDNNLGAVEFMNKNYEEAKTYFEAAASQSPSAKYNLGVLNIMDGDYAAATGNFEGPSFNAALAQLLNGSATQAENTINSVDKNSGWVDYLKAVVAARQKDNDAVYSNLEAAVKKEASIKAYAKTDVEFHRYFDQPDFKSIVK